MEEIERRSVAAWAGGAEVDPDKKRLEFDEWLDSVPDAVSDPDRHELLRALGLRR